MPISIDRFEAETEETLDVTEGTQPYRILKFLAERPAQAFTQTEIHDATDITRGSVGAVLSRLEERDLVRHKGRYWAIGTDDRLASFAAQWLSRKSIATHYGGDWYAENDGWDDDLPDLGESS